MKHHSLLLTASMLATLTGCVGTRPETHVADTPCLLMIERNDNLTMYRVPIWLDDGEPVDVPLRGTVTLSAEPGPHRLSMRPVDTRGLTLWWTPVHRVVDLAFAASAGGIPEFFSTDADFVCVGGESHRFLASPALWGETTLDEVTDEAAEAAP